MDSQRNCHFPGERGCKVRTYACSVHEGIPDKICKGCGESNNTKTQQIQVDDPSKDWGQNKGSQGAGRQGNKGGNW